MGYSHNRFSARGSRNTTRTRSFSTQSRAPRRGPKKDYIDPARFKKTAKLVVEDEYVPMHSFSDFNLHPLIQKNIERAGFSKPSPIQDQAIPVGLTGKDIVGLADTGTGKTAAFVLPIIHALIEDRGRQALILAPTRELAQQIQEAFRQFSAGSGIPGALLIGGTKMYPQLRDLKARPRIVIGTPGRVKDHIQQGTLKISFFNIIALDEVDRMLDMGFINDIRDILGRTAEKRQSFFFSATLDSRVRGVIEDFSNQPVHIAMKTADASESVHQDVVNYAHGNDKIEKLHDLLLQEVVTKTIVFDDTHRTVEKLSKELLGRGFKVEVIHGGKSQSQRQRALQRFKDNGANVLVATDVAARGIDVSDISHVINYSTPQTYNDYIHRIGRAGRAGRVGYAFTFLET